MTEVGKGTYAHVTGELRSREYTTSEGAQVLTYDVIAHKIELLDRKADQNQEVVA